MSRKNTCVVVIVSGCNRCIRNQSIDNPTSEQSIRLWLIKCIVHRLVTNHWTLERKKEEQTWQEVLFWCSAVLFFVIVGDQSSGTTKCWWSINSFLEVLFITTLRLIPFHFSHTVSYYGQIQDVSECNLCCIFMYTYLTTCFRPHMIDNLLWNTEDEAEGCGQERYEWKKSGYDVEFILFNSILFVLELYIIPQHFLF